MSGLVALRDLLLHRYIRTGDRVHLYSGNGKPLGVATARVKGFGKYAAVYAGGGVIRRDGIQRDIATGEWYYTFEGE
jgi:hypothetical protein